MGTNYYLNVNVCAHCGTARGKLHIGKSSGGWCFALHVDPTQGIDDLNEWKRLFNEPENSIEDEYGHAVSVDKMLDIITNRVWLVKSKTPMGYASWAEFYEKNHAEPGPNGLVRHKIEPGHCIAHGEGTWDCITGEFS